MINTHKKKKMKKGLIKATPLQFTLTAQNGKQNKTKSRTEYGREATQNYSLFNIYSTSISSAIVVNGSTNKCTINYTKPSYHENHKSKIQNNLFEDCKEQIDYTTI